MTTTLTPQSPEKSTVRRIVTAFGILLILAGLGNPGVACCVAHGAGRRMGRSEARAKLKEKYVRSALVRTALGSRVICADPALLYEEHPSAYKPIEPVVASLERAGAAVRVASLVPLVTVKT